MTSSKRSPALQNRIFQVREAGSLSQAHQDHPVDKIISLWTTENIRSLLYGKMVIQPVKKGALQWANYVYIELCLTTNSCVQSSATLQKTWNKNIESTLPGGIVDPKSTFWKKEMATRWMMMNACIYECYFLCVPVSTYRWIPISIFDKKHISNHPRFINVWVVAAELLASAVSRWGFVNSSKPTKDSNRGVGPRRPWRYHIPRRIL